jgi:outer membrane protein assembly factor BamA
MTTQTTLLRRAFIASLLLCLAPFSFAQTDQTTDVGPLTVQEITCAGNEQISCEFIRDHLYLKAGQPLDEEEIRNAELRLSSLRNFESVKIRLEKGAQRGAAIVVIEVDEANPITTEWLLGTSSRLDSQRGVFAGRIAHQNLFGKGKFADLSAQSIVPIDGDAHYESHDVTLRYADPQLFNSSRYFAVASAAWRKRRYEDVHGNFGHLDTTQFDLSLGRRFGDFSYFTMGVSYRPGVDYIFGRWKNSGIFWVTEPDYEVTVNLVYGWSTEDDLHFPTHGSTLQLAAGGDYGSGTPDKRSHVQFRKTWASSGTFWTVKVGGDPSPEYRNSFNESQLLALTFARPIAPGDAIQRGRWYVEPGIGFAGYAPLGKEIYEYGIKAGFRADTRLFGLIDLYVLGTADSVR